MVACATQPETKPTPPKVEPVAEAPATVYTLEAPVIPRPEVMENVIVAPEPNTSDTPAVPKVQLGVSREGVPVYLSDFRGKVVLVNFWASWCPPCWSEMAQLETIYTDFRSRGVAIVAVNQGETEQAIESFLNRQVRPLSYVIAADPETHLSRALGVRAVPTSLLFAADGTETARYTGVFGFQPARVRDDIDRLLKSANL